jgi:hypothetical protein
MSHRGDEVRSLAEDLGLHPGDGTPASIEASIVEDCRKQVDAWVAQAGAVRSIDQLERLVSARLQMVTEEISDDRDFDRLTEIYARQKRDPIFAVLRDHFDDIDNPIYGALIRRRKATPQDGDRFVAVVDCRGTKRRRGFFTRWHEIAHRLTTHSERRIEQHVAPELLAIPVFRQEDDPIERLMDDIAGELGFYHRLFLPALEMLTHRDRGVTWQTIDSLRDLHFPAASFHATLTSAVLRSTRPVAFLECATEAIDRFYGGLSEEDPNRLPICRARWSRHGQEEMGELSRTAVPLLDQWRDMARGPMLATQQWTTHDLSLQQLSDGQRPGRYSIQAMRLPTRIWLLIQPSRLSLN